MKNIQPTLFWRIMRGIRNILVSNFILSRILVKISNKIHQISKGHVSNYSSFLNYNLQGNFRQDRIQSIKEESSGGPFISIIIPTYNSNSTLLFECVQSVLQQSYKNFELIIVDDCSTDPKVREEIQSFAKVHHEKIIFKFLETNMHISEATNEGIKLASGEYIGFLDHDDILWCDALTSVAAAINKDKTIDVLYTDEDKIDLDRYHHFDEYLKPDWSPDFLRSMNYITHFMVLRKDLLDKIGGERTKYNGAQDWDLMLRATRNATKIHHIPEVLYSWRVHDDSTAKTTDAKPYVMDAQRKALIDDLEARGIGNFTVEKNPRDPHNWKVTYRIVGSPLVSIIITSSTGNVSKSEIRRVRRSTAYKNIEILTCSMAPEALNSHVASANGEYLAFVSSDIKICNSDWIEELLSDAQRSEIGAVGGLTYYKNKREIQSAGYAFGYGGVAGAILHGLNPALLRTLPQHLYLNTKHNVSIVSPECFIVSKDKFDAVGGFTQQYKSLMFILDFSAKLLDLGLYNIYTPFVESISCRKFRISRDDFIEQSSVEVNFIDEWKKYLNNDLYLNKNFRKNDASMIIYDTHNFPDDDRS